MEEKKKKNKYKTLRVLWLLLHPSFNCIILFSILRHIWGGISFILHHEKDMSLGGGGTE